MQRRIKKAAVIGSGIMGGGIAALCASAGIPTLLLDIVPLDLKEEEKKNPEARNRIVMAGLEAVKKANPAAFMDIKKDLTLSTKQNCNGRARSRQKGKPGSFYGYKERLDVNNDRKSGGRF